MSKQSEAKKKQDYVPSYEPNYCMHCKNFRSDIVQMKNDWVTWSEEKNVRCGIGGFAIKKKGTCMEFSRRFDPVTTDCDVGVEA